MPRPSPTFGRASHFLDYGFAGYLVVLAVNRASTLDLAGCGFVGGLLAVLLGRLSWTEAPLAISTSLAYLGIGSTIVLAFRSWWDSESVRLLALGSCVPGLMIVGACVMMGGSTPPLMDNNLLRMDEILFGSHPSFMLGRFLAGATSLRTVLLMVYQALALALTAMLALEYRYPTKVGLKSALAMVVCPAVLSEFAYLLCPATGPGYVYAFPFGEPDQAALGAIHQFGVINATPSLHVTWTLLLWLAAMRINRKVAIGAFVLLVLTILATLGLGEHYVLDLLAAIPFALLVACSITRRWYDATFGWLAVVVRQLFARPPADTTLLPFALLPLIAVSAYRLTKFMEAHSEHQARPFQIQLSTLGYAGAGNDPE